MVGWRYAGTLDGNVAAWGWQPTAAVVGDIFRTHAKNESRVRTRLFHFIE